MNARLALAAWMLVGLLGCSHPQNAAKDTATTKPDQGIVDEVKARFGGYTETIQVAKAAGHDYLDLVARCFARDESAMHELFDLTAKANFDAAAAEGNSSVLGDVLRDVGDRFYGACLQRESVETRKAIWDELQFDFGVGNSATSEQELADEYPRTFVGFHPTPTTASSGAEEGR